MSRLKKSLLIVVALLTLIVLFIVTALPSIIRSKAAEVVKKSYGRTLVIRKLSINPFTWTVEARGVSLTARGSNAVFFACSSVRGKISPASVYHRAPVLSSLDLVSPYLHLIRNDATTYNFSDLIPAKKTKPVAQPVRFSLNNIRLKQGAIDFTDLLLPEKQRRTVRKLEISIPFLSNLPYLADTYITPGMSALVDGAPFSLEGKLKPFSRQVEFMVEVKLTDLNLPSYAAYLPATVPLRLRSGKLTTDLRITHRAVAAGRPEMIVSGPTRITGLDLRDRRDAPLCTLDGGLVRIRQALLMAGLYEIDAVELTSPNIHLFRDRQGMLNVMGHAHPVSKMDETPRLGTEKQGKTLKEETKQPTDIAVTVNVAKITLEKGQIHFRDEAPPGGFAVDLDAISLDVSGLSTQKNMNAQYKLSFATNRKEQFDLSGAFTVAPPATATKVMFSGLALDAVSPYLAEFLTAPLSGKLDGSATLSFTPETGPRITDLSLALKRLAVKFGVKDGIMIPDITLKGGAVDLKERRAAVEGVVVKGGSLIVSRAADGALSPLSLLRPPAPARPLPASPATAQPQPLPFRYKVTSVNVIGIDLGFTDYMNKEAPSFTIKKATLSLGNLTSGGALMPFGFSARLNGGSLNSTGTLGVTPFRFSGACNLKGIPIADFDAYYPEELHLIIADGILDTDLSVTLTAATEGMTGTFQGDMTLKRFHSLDEDEGEDLLKWDNLHLGGIRGTLKPFSLTLAQVALTDYFARVTIEKDATLNLQKLYVSKTAGRPSSPPLPSPPTQPAAPAPSPTGKIAIDAVTLQGGTLVFSDHHITPEFSATMYHLGGKINGLSSEQMKFADVDLRGNLRNQSPLGITGKINPLRGDLFVDMKVSFADIELAPLSPYSGAYLGYTVDKGKLFLDLMYQIENKRLTSENRVFIDQFTFGDKVESDQATKLPVRLAIALLKDSKGEIHLDLPVTGRTDDPKFSIWKVIGQVLMNLFEKAATAPFKLLGALFSGSESFSGIAFAPGSTELTGGEQQKLSKLGKVLADRPTLNLEVRGFVDKQRDPEGYRQELLRKKMRNEKFLELVKEKKNIPGQTAEEMTLAPEELSTWLAAVYKKEKFPKPRNVVGLVKELPDHEMRKLIFANTPVGEEELSQLARERVVAVMNYLVSAAGAPRERIFERSGALSEIPQDAGTAASRVEFRLAPK